jgi:translation initiation factor 1 (eIF-1/SUI1)
VIKLHRGGKKLICSVIGLERYGCNLEEVARMMKKKFGTGAAAM